jgi:type IV pilus assembly protein PilY1
VNISDFDAAQRATWYSSFYAIVPNNSTPLRVALANAGRMFAHKLSGSADPMQYSCQQNFTIMTTDGMWNENTNPKQLDGTTDIGNQDNTAPRPMYDGSSYNQTTKQNQKNTSVNYKDTVQTQALQTQSITSNLQSQTSQLQKQTNVLQSQTSQLQSSTSTLQGILSKVLMRCNNTTAICGTAPATGVANANWSIVTSGTCSTATNVQCSTVSGLSGSGSVATTCKTTASIASSTVYKYTITVTGVNTSTTFANSKLKIDNNRILSSTTTASSTNNGVASAIAADVTNNGYTATVLNNVVTVTGSTNPITSSSTISATSASSGSATIAGASVAGNTYTLNNADSNGHIYSSCTYSTWSAGTGTASCIATAQSGTPNNTTVVAATQCNTVVTSPYASAGSCMATSAPDGSGNTTQCQYTTGAWVGTPTCTAVAQSTGPSYTVGTATNCQTIVISPYANTSSCSATTIPDGSGNTTKCQYTAWNAWANASSCTALAQSAASPYTVGTATQCQAIWMGVNSCTAGSGGQTACQTVTSSTAVASCSPSTASSANSWTTTSCPPATTTPWVGVSSCTAVAASSANGYTATNCNSANPVTTTTNVTLCTASSATAANNWIATTCSGLIGGTPNTLADTAYYYWQNDLRTSGLGNCTGVLGTDVCYNNVRGSGTDVNNQQHMTTFTLGLGVVGTLNPDGYPTLSTDFNNLKTGPNNWSVPVSNTNTTIDDLWHAAVNGRGIYFSAKSPDALVSGLSQALEGVKSRQGASAAASTSNMQPVPGDNYAYVALFNTNTWDGDLLAKQIDPNTAQFIKDTVTNKDVVLWSAQTQLDTLVGSTSDTRTIYTFDGTAANKLKDFTWSNLNATEQGYFSNICSSPYMLSQCTTLISNDTANGTTTATAASGANLVNFLRGQHGFEDLVTNTSKIYRSRAHVLGDIVSAQPQYVRKPPFDYTDMGYAAFSTAQVNRAPMVYSAANDGMLHAFSANTGTEQWAYIPPLVLPNLYRLASKDYSSNHRYFTDGTPTVADVCPNAPTSSCTAAQWKSILVAGFNGGGRGYYALDVTDPANPKALWNYTVTDQPNLGYTYGNPVVIKRKDKCNGTLTVSGGVTTCSGTWVGGTWVVAISSGYNNVSPGDGNGHLFILNATTGALLEDIVTNICTTGAGTLTSCSTSGSTSTPAGNNTTPSGLSKINAWVEIPGDNTAERFYGGDLLGNVWRFDIDNNVPPAGKEALLLAQLGGVDLPNKQPITIKPELADNGGVAEVMVATGRYLGTSDLSNTDQQSIYALKDNLTSTGLGLARTSGVLVKQTLTATYLKNGVSYRQGAGSAVDWSTKAGWYVDLNPANESPGERVNTDMSFQQKTLAVFSNVPDPNACNVGGYAFTYYLDYVNGIVPADGGIKDSSNSLIAGTTQIMDSSGKTHTIITHTDGSVTIQSDAIPPPPLGPGRRTSWRELN